MRLFRVANPRQIAIGAVPKQVSIVPDYLYIGGNRSVYALRASDCSVAWTTELNSGWFNTGSPFVSLRETEVHLFAFAHGKLYQLDKRTGSILRSSDQIKALKHRAGVFSTSSEQEYASSEDAALLGDDGCGDGGGDGDGDGGGDGGGD